MAKEFYSVELNKDSADKFRTFLKANGFYYEPSACYNLTHFEVCLSPVDVPKVNEFLDTL